MLIVISVYKVSLHKNQSPGVLLATCYAQRSFVILLSLVPLLPGEGIFQVLLISEHVSSNLLASIESTLLLILALLLGDFE